MLPLYRHILKMKFEQERHRREVIREKGGNKGGPEIYMVELPQRPTDEENSYFLVIF